MDVLQKIAAFLVTLGVLVIFHELGHYIVARLAGVKVLRFSVGFGRVLWARRFGRDRTEWAVSAIPLGGYVKMADEREGDVAPEDLPRAFNRQGVGKRIAIVAAGPIANLLLAVLFYGAGYMSGIPGTKPLLAEPPAGSPAYEAGIRGGDLVTGVANTPLSSWQDLRWALLQASGRSEVDVDVAQDGAQGDAPQRRATRVLRIDSLAPADWEGDFMPRLGFKSDLGAPLVAEVVPGKPAARAGIAVGDHIVAIEGEAVRSPSEVAARTNAHPGEKLTFSVEREDRVRDIVVTPEARSEGGRTIGIAGLALRVDPAIAQQLSVTVRYGAIDALAHGVRRTVELSAFTLRMLGRMIVGQASLKNISGPITMADYAGQSAQQGLLAFVSYLALISISLGVLNLLPVPLLDGGHLLYYFIEIIKGSPVSDRAFEVGQRVGIAVLAALMALALFNDLSRQFF